MNTLTLALLLAAIGFNAAVAADTLTIIHVNDTHSNLAPGGRRGENLQGTLGGIARAATYIGMTKQQHPDAMLLHAGDIYIGDLFFQKYYGVAELQLMAMLGFDAMAVGNHEFDLTPATLQTALDTAFKSGVAFPLLSANTILDNDTVKGLKKYIQPSFTKQIGAVKVGVFGMTTPETNLLSLPAPAVIDTNIIQIATQQVAALKAQGCNVVIMLSHLGLSLDQAVAQYVGGINLIVGGHDHYVLEQAVTVNNTPIVQAGAFYHEIGVVQLSVDNNEVKLISSKVDELNEQIPEEPTVAGVVGNLVADIEATYGKVYTAKIAHADDDCHEVAGQLTQNGNKDTPLANIVTDAFRAYGNTDIAIQPGGSLAQQLYKGSLVSADAFRAVGYGFNTDNGLGFRMASYNLAGTDILGGIEFGLSAIEQNDEFLLQCSGMEYTYDPTSPQFQRLRGATVGGKAIDPAKRYTVTTNEFVLAFLGILGIQPENIVMHGDTTEFMVLAGYLQAVQSITPKVEGRIKSTGASDVKEYALRMENVVASPNPAKNQLAISLSEDMSNAAIVKVYSSALKEITLPATISGRSIALDISSLPNGVYIYRVETKSNIAAGQFVVSK